MDQLPVPEEIKAFVRHVTYRYSSAAGRVIIVHGPDHTGKSSFIDILRFYLLDNGVLPYLLNAPVEPALKTVRLLVDRRHDTANIGVTLVGVYRPLSQYEIKEFSQGFEWTSIATESVIDGYAICHVTGGSLKGESSFDLSISLPVLAKAVGLSKKRFGFGNLMNLRDRSKKPMSLEHRLSPCTVRNMIFSQTPYPELY